MPLLFELFIGDAVNGPLRGEFMFWRCPRHGVTDIDLFYSAW